MKKDTRFQVPLLLFFVYGYRHNSDFYFFFFRGNHAAFFGQFRHTPVPFYCGWGEGHLFSATGSGSARGAIPALPPSFFSITHYRYFCNYSQNISFANSWLSDAVKYRPNCTCCVILVILYGISRIFIQDYACLYSFDRVCTWAHPVYTRAGAACAGGDPAQE